MGFKVVITTRANEDLRQVVSFLAAKNPAAAERLGFRLLDAAQALAHFPYRGTRVPERAHVRRVACPPWHVIYFRVWADEHLVEITRIWDGRRNPATGPAP